jgi:uncharacterized protein YkwD
MKNLSRRNFITLFSGALLSSFTNVTHSYAAKSSEYNAALFLKKINQVRAAHGARPFTYNKRLAKAAQTHSNLMARRNKMSHNLGASLPRRTAKVGYHGAVGENLASGYATLENVIEGWLRSPGHRATLLSKKYTEFGLAHAKASKDKNNRHRDYWTLIAGKKV